MSFGYIGTAGKTQTQISNSGVFSLDEVQDLKDDFTYAGQGLLCDFLVVAGGAGGGAGHQNGGAGGGGGMRSSVDNKGGRTSGTVENKYLLYHNKTYKVKVGSGSGAGRSSAGQSRLGKIVSIGGGGGYSGSSQSGYGGNAGGAGGSGPLEDHYSFSDFRTEYNDSDTNPDYPFTEDEFYFQGYDANAKGGGGAGGDNSSNTGAAGAYSNILPSGSASGYVGEVSSSNVYYSGGGGEGAASWGQNSNSNSFNYGGLGGGGNASQNGSANTGGGGGSGYVGGNGGSGVVILSYDDSHPDITTIGGGLTYTKVETGGKKIYTFTAGSDIITI